MKTITKILSLPVFILLVLAIGIRIAFSNQTDPVTTFPDSVGYDQLGQTFLANPSFHTFITPFRMPVYPMLFALNRLLFPYPPTFEPIVILQTTLSIMLVVFTYITLKKIRVSTVLSLCASSILAIHPVLLSYEHVLLTESLSASLLGFSFLFLLWFVQTHSMRWLVYASLAISLAMGIRPSFLLIPFLFTPLVLYGLLQERKPKQSWFVPLGILAFPLVLSGFYAVGNMALHGYLGLQYVKEINLMGKILQYNLPTDAFPNQQLAANFTVYKATFPNGMIYEFLDMIGFTYSDSTSVRVLADTANTTIRTYVREFMVHTMYLYPKTLINHEPIVRLSPLSPFFPFFFSFYGSLIWFWLLIPFFAIVSCTLMFIRPKLSSVAACVGWISVLFYTLQSAALGYEAYERLNTPIIPIAAISFFLTLHAIRRKLP